jgi:hypothetical protein
MSRPFPLNAAAPRGSCLALRLSSSALREWRAPGGPRHPHVRQVRWSRDPLARGGERLVRNSAATFGRPGNSIPQTRSGRGRVLNHARVNPAQCDGQCDRSDQRDSDASDGSPPIDAASRRFAAVVVAVVMEIEHRHRPGGNPLLAVLPTRSPGFSARWPRSMPSMKAITNSTISRAFESPNGRYLRRSSGS